MRYDDEMMQQLDVGGVLTHKGLGSKTVLTMSSVSTILLVCIRSDI